MNDLAIAVFGIVNVFTAIGIIALHFRLNDMQEANNALWRNASDWMRLQEEINESNDL